MYQNPTRHKISLEPMNMSLSVLVQDQGFLVWKELDKMLFYSIFIVEGSIPAASHSPLLIQ